MVSRSQQTARVFLDVSSSNCQMSSFNSAEYVSVTSADMKEPESILLLHYNPFFLGKNPENLLNSFFFTLNEASVRFYVGNVFNQT